MTASTLDIGARGYTVADDAAVDRAVTAAREGMEPTTTMAPPTDTQKYSYLRRSRRWVLPLQTLLFLPTLYSVARFSLSAWWLTPFLLWVGLMLVNTLVGAWSSNQSRRVTLASHTQLVEEYCPSAWTSIDVFLPTAGEPLEVLVNTYRHVAALEYPGEVALYVLDDGDRSEVAAAADRFGFDYLVRPDRGVLKKAGNLRNALTRTGNDLVLVLDADFVPRPDMLTELVPYMADPTVGIVQSPQYFDTSVKQNWMQRCAGATQELFYRWVQPSRDALGVAICVGTSALYRRSALDAAGGFAAIEHSEDVHTGVKLRKAGYGLRYVPVLLSKGLSPAGIKPFISQQYRWASGSMSLMKDSSFYTDADLGFKRLLPYVAGFMYYITTALAVFIAMLPGPIMMWFFPQDVNPMNYLPLIGGPLIWFLIMPLVAKGHWRVEVLRVHMLYSLAHAVALRDILRGRTAGWVPTGSKPASNPVATTVIRTLRVLVPFNLLAFVTGIVHVSLDYGFDQVWPAAIYATIFAYIAAPLLFAPRVLSWRQILLGQWREQPTVPAPTLPPVDSVDRSGLRAA